MLAESGIGFYRECTGVGISPSGMFVAYIKTTYPDAYKIVYTSDGPERVRPAIYNSEITIGGKNGWADICIHFKGRMIKRAQRYIDKLQRQLND